MPGTIAHSPADIVRQALVSGGLGTSPEDELAWPVSFAGERSSPDELITVYDTEGSDLGRNSKDYERSVYQGILVRIRSSTPRSGHVKSEAVREFLNNIQHLVVTIDSDSYCLQTVILRSGPLALGKDSPTSKRNLFTINALVYVRQIP